MQCWRIAAVTTTNFHRGVLRCAISELCFDGARAGDRWATAGFPRARPGGAKEARIGERPTLALVFGRHPLSSFSEVTNSRWSLAEGTSRLLDKVHTASNSTVGEVPDKSHLTALANTRGREKREHGHAADTVVFSKYLLLCRYSSMTDLDRMCLTLPGRNRTEFRAQATSSFSTELDSM